MIYYLIFIYYSLWLQNSNLKKKSDINALITITEAKITKIIYFSSSIFLKLLSISLFKIIVLVSEFKIFN